MDLEKEINDMEELITADVDKFAEDEKVEEIEEVKEVKEEVIEPVKIEEINEKLGDVKIEEVKVVEPSLDESANLKAELEILKAENLKLKEVKPVEIKDKESTEVKPIDEISEQDFIGDKDIDDLIRDPKEFNKVLNAVLMKGIEIGKDHNRRTAEGVIKSIPEITKKNVEIVINLKKLSDQFYEDNKDLASFKKVVSLIFEEKIAANPDKTYEEVLRDVAPEVRKRLELHQKTINDQKPNDQKPTLPRVKGQQRITNQPKTNAIESELSEMDKALNF